MYKCFTLAQQSVLLAEEFWAWNFSLEILPCYLCQWESLALDFWVWNFYHELLQCFFCQWNSLTLDFWVWNSSHETPPCSGCCVFSSSEERTNLFWRKLAGRDDSRMNILLLFQRPWLKFKQKNIGKLQLTVGLEHWFPNFLSLRTKIHRKTFWRTIKSLQTIPRTIV